MLLAIGLLLRPQYRDSASGSEYNLKFPHLSAQFPLPLALVLSSPAHLLALSITPSPNLSGGKGTTISLFQEACPDPFFPFESLLYSRTRPARRLESLTPIWQAVDALETE